MLPDDEPDPRLNTTPEEVNDDDDNDPDQIDEPESGPDEGAEGDGDESGESGDSGEEDTTLQDEGQRPQVSRATARVQAALKAKKDAEERAANLERELQAARAPRGKSPAELAAEQAAERARLELMSPDEKVDYYRQKDRNEFDSKFNLIQFQLGDSNDRAGFQALCARKAHLAEIADDVERQLTEIRRNGGNASRQAIAYYILGQRADSRADKARSKQTRVGQRNIDRQRATPSGGARSNTSPGRRETDEKSARAKRLENMQI